MESQRNRVTASGMLPVITLLVVALVGRLVPHPPNFSPLGAIALFGAAVLSSRWLAILIPFTALYLSDLVLNNVVYAEYQESFTWGISGATYLGFAAIIGLGFLALRGKAPKPGRLFFTALSASVVFYLITNFFSWYLDPFNLYANNFTGLLASYVAALPFFFNSVAGDLVFVGVLFGAYQWFARKRTVTA